MKFWQKILSTACLTLTMTVPLLPATAQVGEESTCREVNTRNTNLNVRANPNTSSRIVGSLARGTTVTITSEIGDWVPITAPVEGYVYSPYLKYCGETPVVDDTAAVAPDTNTTASTSVACRQVSFNKVAPVRQEPSVGSPIVTTLGAGREMTIVNTGAMGWVPISTPVDGYVASSQITDCN